MNRDLSSNSFAVENPTLPIHSVLPAQALKTEPAATIPLTPSNQKPDQAAIAQLENLSAIVAKEIATESISPLQPPRASQASSASSAHSDDECLDSYLQRYVRQLTGKSDDASSPPPPVGSETPSEAGLAETLPRRPTQAPEFREQISAMRELAIDSARSALAASAHGDLAGKTRSIFVATKAVSYASSTLAVAYLLTRSPVAVVGAALFFVLAVLMSFRFVGLCRKLTK